jgi:hypothetical protein
MKVGARAWQLIEGNPQIVISQLKAITHDFFSLGVGVYLVYHVEQLPALLYLLLTVWLAFATNEIIDGLGHVRRGDGVPVRSFWTHSILTAPIWGISVAIVSLYLLDTIVGQAITIPHVLFAAELGVVLVYSHLLLDAFTEGGVYLGRRRVALAHMRYNNLILNGAFAALGVVLVFAALM